MLAICPNLLARGACGLSTCSYAHDVEICRPCGVICYTDRVYRAHLAGRPHQNRLSGRSTVYHCPICEINMGATSWTAHVSGKRHQRTALQLGVQAYVEPEEEAELPDHIFCGVCSTNVPERKWGAHTGSRQHAKKLLFTKYEAALDEAESDKHGITVSHVDEGLDFGVVELSDAQEGVVKTLKINNTVPQSRVQLVSVTLGSRNRRGPRPFEAEISPQPIMSGRPTNVKVIFQYSYRGRYQDRIELVFEDTSLRKRFLIVRFVKGIIGSQADHRALRPTAPYVPRKRGNRSAETDVVLGVPPPASKAVPYVVDLPPALIPRYIASVLEKGSIAEMINTCRNSILPRTSNAETHGRHFKALLWIEEHRSESDLQIYDIPDAQLTTHNQYYYLAVPGLAEKRPSVLVGDRIFVQPHGTDRGRWFEGHVHFVRQHEVGLRFHGSFPVNVAGALFNVRFKLNRIPLRRQHQALDTAFDPERLLSPVQGHFSVTTARDPSSAGIRSSIYNSLIVSNPPQLQAVTSIACLPPGSPPFVIFGPPGTGKTITLVESIRQILLKYRTARILAIAPSNSAADLIAIRLKMLSTSELFRFYAPSRAKDQIPDELRPFSYTSSTGHFSVPPLAVLRRFRVVVSTCISASFAHGVGLPRGHFTHIFVDEAGQATEPEVMTAVRTMADNDTNVILSGDPKQLGPIIRSPVARRLGLEKSFLERLMEQPTYDERRKHGISVVKLVQNFRSHPAILRFSNEHFYNGDLQPCGDPRVINSYLRWTQLPCKTFPVIIHAISGKDDREASSPSFFNVDEAIQVKTYVQALRSDRRYHITDSDIGIIAPYHAQCVKLRSALRGVADDVKVGSVEEFQGQERRVIIISTVRSSKEFVEYDLKHTLGFVANPRRFNVAVTRAKALLIVVGDPEVLSLDPLWRSFLVYVHNAGGWVGNEPSWDTQAVVDPAGKYDKELRDAALADMNEFARKMEMLALDEVNGGGGDDDDANVDRPWREVE